MSEREGGEKSQKQSEGPQQRHQANIKVFRPTSMKKKPGQDRRIGLRTKAFDENLHKKLDGQEIPKTLKVCSVRESRHFCICRG